MRSMPTRSSARRVAWSADSRAVTSWPQSWKFAMRSSVASYRSTLIDHGAYRVSRSQSSASDGQARRSCLDLACAGACLWPRAHLLPPRHLGASPCGGRCTHPGLHALPSASPGRVWPGRRAPQGHGRECAPPPRTTLSSGRRRAAVCAYAHLDVRSQCARFTLATADPCVRSTDPQDGAAAGPKCKYGHTLSCSVIGWVSDRGGREALGGVRPAVGPSPLGAPKARSRRCHQSPCLRWRTGRHLREPALARPDRAARSGLQPDREPFRPGHWAAFRSNPRGCAGRGQQRVERPGPQRQSRGHSRPPPVRR